eukprot:7130541-Prymnesium_polylepis.1
MATAAQHAAPLGAVGGRGSRSSRGSGDGGGGGMDGGGGGGGGGAGFPCRRRHTLVHFLRSTVPPPGHKVVLAHVLIVLTP